MRKLSFLIGAGVGYVLGARAGREQYDRITEAARKVRSDPTVQQAKDNATELGGEMLGEVKDKAAEKAPGWVPGSRSGEAPPAGAAPQHTNIAPA